MFRGHVVPVVKDGIIVTGLDVNGMYTPMHRDICPTIDKNKGSSSQADEELAEEIARLRVD
jgi:hypothetical protein